MVAHGSFLWRFQSALYQNDHQLSYELLKNCIYLPDMQSDGRVTHHQLVDADIKQEYVRTEQ
jgi:hypothetical protein